MVGTWEVTGSDQACSVGYREWTKRREATTFDRKAGGRHLAAWNGWRVSWLRSMIHRRRSPVHFLAARHRATELERRSGAQNPDGDNRARRTWNSPSQPRYERW